VSNGSIDELSPAVSEGLLHCLDNSVQTNILANQNPTAFRKREFSGILGERIQGSDDTFLDARRTREDSNASQRLTQLSVSANR
jgi:hypothetical protein